MWIRSQTQELLESWLRESPALKLAKGPDGQIYWANEAFCEWSRYTVSELQEMGWMKLSVQDGSFKADMQAMEQLVEGFDKRYTCQKQYIPKNGQPQWGNLTVTRYPYTGELSCFLCTFEPLKNGTATAFALAVDHIKQCQESITGLEMAISTITKRDQDEDWIVSTVRIMKRYPKIAAFVLAMMMGVLGANNLLELLERLSGVGVPVPQAVQAPDAVQLPRPTQ